jgi:hypothetical protein
MSKQEIFAEIVNELNEIADVIRSRNGNVKSITTDTMATREKYSPYFLYRYEYRLRHIAYSELRGKSREQIEKPSEPLRDWDEQAILKHKERYSEIIQKYKMENSQMEIPCE